MVAAEGEKLLNFDASSFLENALFKHFFYNASFLFNKYPQAESCLMV